MEKVSEQLIAEIKRQIEEIDRVAFGDIVFRIQSGTVITWDVKKTFKPGAGQKNWRSERKA